MVKLTILGRVRDGLPLAKSSWHTNKATTAAATASHLSLSYSYYNRQAELILKEVSRGALSSPKTTIWLDHQYSFHFLIANGVCFITMCEASYPRKLAFYYLQDLQTELEKHFGTVEKVTKPYSLAEFGDTIDRIRKHYIDTRTRANLSKLSSKRRHEEKNEEIASEIFSTILEKRRQEGTLEREVASQRVSPVRSSPLLEAIALRWTPITLVVAVVTVLLWAGFVMEDYLVLNS